MSRYLVERKQPVEDHVYDIMNCGPRNRFVANGKLVHNSGAERLNVQNFPRGGALREAMGLPDGWTMMSCDLSQIEARLNAYNAGQEDVLQQFRDKKDIYSEFGTVVYGYPVSKGTPKERQVAKCAVLGLGYGMGKAKFELYSKQQNVHLSTDEAGRIVDVYRRKHKNIVASWTACDTVLWNMVRGKSGALNHFVRYDPEKIILPGGITIMYPALQPLPDGSRGYRYIKDPRSYKKWQSGETEGIQWGYVFGSKIVENIIQGTARVVITEHMNEIAKRYKVLFQVHDEIVIAVKDEEVNEAKMFMESVMRTSPYWAPDLPLDCECKYGKSYKDCK